jgi:MFS family permease
MGRVSAWFRESLSAFREVFHNPGLRRLQLAFAESELGDWGAAIALAVLAFEEHGATGVGLLMLIRMIPAALAAPFTSILGDRHDRVLVMLSSDLVRSAAMAGLAVVAFADGPLWSLYALAAVVSVASTAFRPAQAAILPSLARTPDELTAANVASSTIESVTSFVGPALGGVILAATSAGVTFAIAAVTFAVSALLLSRLRVQGKDEAAEKSPGKPSGGILRLASAGVRTIVVEPNVRLLSLLFGAQTLVAGALNVLVVVVALELLDSGERGLGALNAALGVGGILGAAAALGLVGRRRLAAAFGLGTLAWGMPIALMAAWTEEAGAFILLGIVGLANTVVDVAGFTLLQRAVPDEVLARVFGALESIFLGTVALGGLIASALIEGLGIEAALVATGAFLPVVIALTWTRIVRIDAGAPAPGAELELLRSTPIFAALPATTLEQLASNLAPVSVPAGQAIFHQGDAGDRFYVIAKGEVDVSVDGAATAPLGPGDFFGEIALLRDVPRTATVTARTAVSAWTLERDEFIAAVTGHAPSAEAAGAVVAARLGALRPGLGPV